MKVAALVPASPSVTLRSLIEACGSASSLRIVPVAPTAPGATFTRFDRENPNVSSFS